MQFKQIHKQIYSHSSLKIFNGKHHIIQSQITKKTQRKFLKLQLLYFSLPLEGKNLFSGCGLSCTKTCSKPLNPLKQPPETVAHLHPRVCGTSLYSPFLTSKGAHLLLDYPRGNACSALEKGMVKGLLCFNCHPGYKMVVVPPFCVSYIATLLVPLPGPILTGIGCKTSTGFSRARQHIQN